MPLRAPHEPSERTKRARRVVYTLRAFSAPSRLYFENLSTTATTFSKKWRIRFGVFKFAPSGADNRTRTCTVAHQNLNYGKAFLWFQIQLKTSLFVHNFHEQSSILLSRCCQGCCQMKSHSDYLMYNHHQRIFFPIYSFRTEKYRIFLIKL